MKKRNLIGFIVVLYLLAGTSYLFAQDAAAQKAMMDYMTPGKMHELLAKNAGEWKSTIKLWMAPGTQPVISEGSAVSEMILGGRYLQSKHSGTVMGMPLMGLGIDAFDNGKKIFISTWYDNMGTGVMVLKGTYDEASKTMNLEGMAFEPVSGKEIKVREVIKFVKDGHQTMEMFMGEGAEEFKSMEIDMIKIK